MHAASFGGVTPSRTHKAAGLTTLQFHAHREGMMVLVRASDSPRKGAEGTETRIVCLVNDEKAWSRLELRLFPDWALC